MRRQIGRLLGVVVLGLAVALGGCASWWDDDDDDDCCDRHAKPDAWHSVPDKRTRSWNR